MNIDLNSLLNNDNGIYALRIIPPESSGAADLLGGVGLIKGFLTNQLSWSASNTWEGLHQGFSSIKNQESNIAKIETITSELKIGDAAADNAGIGAGQHAVQGITESIARYTGSQKPTFSFNMMLVSLTPDTDIITPVKILLKGCYPKTAAMGMMEAPYGYETGITGGVGENDTLSGKIAASAKNVWSVRAGKWFYCPMLVLDSCNVNFSQQCTPAGKPLFAEVQLVFETWRLITANEVDTFFAFGKASS